MEDDLTNLLISKSELRHDEYPLSPHLQRIASSIDTPLTKLLPHLSSPYMICRGINQSSAQMQNFPTTSHGNTKEEASIDEKQRERFLEVRAWIEANAVMISCIVVSALLYE